MSRLDWSKAKKATATRTLSDETEWTGKDAAARWLKRNEVKPAKRAQKKKCPPQRREDKRAGPVDARPGIVIYTDGACEPNPGKGGWGFVVYEAGVEIYTACGGDPIATNNIMEMTAVKMALIWLGKRDISGATILSDSQYVVKGCNEWRHGWKAKGWRRVVDRKSGKLEPVKNADLWKELDEYLRAVPVKIEWVKGHAGIRGNERADELSNVGRREATEQGGRLKAAEDQLRYSI